MSLLVWALLLTGPVCAQQPGRLEQLEKPDGARELEPILARLLTAAERVTMGGRMGTAGDSLPDVVDLCRAMRWLQTESPADRYTHLKNWMFPATPDAPLRNAQCFVPVEFPPEWFFQPEAASHSGRAGPVVDHDAMLTSDGVVSFLELLVQAAAATHRVDELSQLAADRADHCEIARGLTRLASFVSARAKGESPDPESLRVDLRHAIAAPGNARVKLWPVFLMARALCADDAYRSVGIGILDELLRVSEGVPLRPLQSHCVRERAVARVALAGGHVEPGIDPQLKLWQVSGYYFNSGSQAGTWPAWWVAHDGVILRVSGPEVSTLQFACPLTGTWEFSARATGDIGADPAVQFGRITLHSHAGPDKVTACSIGEQETVPCKAAPTSNQRGVIIRISATPESVGYYQDNQLVFEDRSPSPTTPWLALVARGPRSCAWTDVQFTGAPEIPSEVHLIGEDRMEGWMSPLYRERLPRQFAMQPLESGGIALQRPQDGGGEWSVVNGELIGKSMGPTAGKITSQSWLAYHRALQPGDTLSYEFYYEPDRTIVWPSLGRTAFLLEPTGVRLHWITDIPHMAVGGLNPNNAASDPRVPHQGQNMPLRPHAWNALVLTIVPGSAQFTLNGTRIYEHPLAASDSRMFGLFHYRSHSQARVRAVVLRGTWPTTLSADELAHPTQRRDAGSIAPAELTGLQTLLDEPWIVRSPAQ